MRVRACRRERHECPEELKFLIQESGAFTTIGEEYEVHAISVFNGIATVQIVDDLRYPAWYPVFLFEVIDDSLASDWLCRLYPPNNRTELAIVIGPAFLVRDPDGFRAMLELEADPVDQFWKRIDALSNEG